MLKKLELDYEDGLSLNFIKLEEFRRTIKYRISYQGP
jgi:hypothetical protein